MPQILYRGPKREEEGGNDGIGGSGKKHRRKFSGKSDTSESPFGGQELVKKEGGEERGSL
jgi:hypothetical protein